MNPILLYDNKLDTGTLASSALASGSVENIRDGRPYTHVVFSAAGTNYISVDIGASKTVDCVAVVGHNLKTVGASFKVQYDNAGWIDVSGGSITPTDDNAFMISFNSVTSSKFKLVITNSSGAPYVGVIYLGAKLLMPWPPDPAPVPFSEGINAETSESESGNILGSTVKSNPIEITHSFRLLTRTFISTYWLPFWNSYGKRMKPFFYAWDLTAIPGDVFFCVMKSSARFAAPVSMLTYVDELIIDMKAQR
ncbi:MAG: discoidin domain-containing protein [Melioribacteraceae bacterium]